MRYSLLPRILAVATFVGAQPVHAQTWEPDPTFRQPVLEDDDVSPTPVLPLATADGRVIIPNAYRYVNGAAATGVIRLNADGSTDTAFQPPSTRLAEVSRPLFAYSDGRVLIFDGKSRIIRLLSDGQPDPTYLPVETVAGAYSRSVSAPDGRLAVWQLDRPGDDQNLIVLRPDGGLDAAFAFPVGSIVNARDVAFQADGKIVVAGGIKLPGPAYLQIARFNSDGSHDPTFDASVAAPTGTSGGEVDTLAVLPDGKILIANYVRIARLLQAHSRKSTPFR